MGDIIQELKAKGCVITSPENQSYNCVSWAANTDPRNMFWWPEPNVDYYWPEGIERRVRLSAFIKLFASLGYTNTDDDCFEPECIKVAIYVKGLEYPTHVARQLENGKWTSKLGFFEDIEHTSLKDIIPECGDKVAAILKRPIKLS